MVIDIEKGIEVPSPEQRKGNTRIYPFPSMVIGDSFFIPSDSTPQRVASLIRASVANYRRSFPNTQFITMVVDGGVRCWRVA